MIDIQHVTVYSKPGMFAGWPANHGIWSWDNEILVGLSLGYHKDHGPRRHAIDLGKPECPMLVRSVDGGESWTVDISHPTDVRIPFDFTHRDFLLTARARNSRVHIPPSDWYYSLDRGRQWDGPIPLPMFDQTRIMARTDYIVLGKEDCLLLLTAAKPDNREGRPFVARTKDGGTTWQFVSWICAEPLGYAIMPSTVRIGPTELLTIIRCQKHRKCWLDSYRSFDLGETWDFEQTVVADTGRWGNPGHLIRLNDGRLCLTWGQRSESFGIRARFSDDAGRTWQPEIILRDDGGSWDIGYPRTAQRADGKLVTVYYYCDKPDGERYIAATIWSPPAP